MKISTLITGKAVYTITADTSIAVLVEKLASLKVGALVVSPDGIRITGIVSERDIVAALPIHFHELGRLHVRDIMTVNVTTCTPHSSVAELMTLMTERRIRHVPVVNDAGELISIISIGDIVKSHVSEIDSERIALVDYLFDGSFLNTRHQKITGCCNCYSQNESQYDHEYCRHQKSHGI
jgi:CBS domain-containing protein